MHMYRYLLRKKGYCLLFAALLVTNGAAGPLILSGHERVGGLCGKKMRRCCFGRFWEGLGTR